MRTDTLRTALLTNAGFSGVTGLLALVLAGSLATSLGPPAWSLRALGVGLIVFGIAVTLVARAPQPRRAWEIIAADLAWVATATVVIAVAPGWTTAAGRTVLAVVTVAVAALAAAQWWGLRRVR